MCIRIVAATVAITFLASPVQAQCIPGWFGCYQPPQFEPYQPIRTERRHDSHRSHSRRVAVSERHDAVKREPPPKPKIIYREKTWQSMSQDDARNWIKEQAQTFCGKYPKDEACQKRE